MGDFNEYIFCPHCGGITIPGICVNCGMRTNSDEEQGGNRTDTAVKQNENGYSASGAGQGGYSKYQPQNTAAGYNQYQPQNTAAEHNQYQSQNSAADYNKYQPKPEQPKAEQSSANAQNQAGNQYIGYQSNPSNMQGTQPAYGGYGQPVQASAQQGNTANVPYTCNPPKKKSSWWIWLLVIGILLFLGLFVIVFAIIFGPVFIKMMNTSSVSASPIYDISDSSDPYDVPDISDPLTPDSSEVVTATIFGRDLGRLNFDIFDWDSYAQNSMVYSDTTDGSKDLYLNKDYSSTFGTNHDNHSLDEFSGMYFEAFCDCIDTSYDYRLERHFVDYSNVHDDIIVNGKIAYIQFAGDHIPNEDAINEKIMEMTMNDFWGYLDGQKSFYSVYSELNFMIDSYIPYNDGEKMSILLDVNIYDGDYRDEHHIYAINIDLVNGEIMDNASIIDVNDELVALFRERNDDQNGTDVYGVNYATDEEIMDFLSDSDTNIIFFTPYGMEIGYNYESSSSSWGWVTVTLPEYEDYLK